MTPSHKSDIETALDLMDAVIRERGGHTKQSRAAYLRAIAVYRDIPSGHRRVRSDFETRRDTRQMELAS